MPLEYDSIVFNGMEPDSSPYDKGLQEVINAVPYEGGSWREITASAVFGSVGVPAGTINSGSYSDPAGSIWVGLTNPSAPAGYVFEYDPVFGTFTNRSAGAIYGGAPSRWSFTKFGSAVIAAPWNVGAGAAIQLQSRAAGNFANLVASVDRPAPKFIGVCKSHLVGAHNLANGGAGVYAAGNARQVMWCARNDATTWTPGVDRAGFAPDLSDDLGEITGLLCFKDFFLVFQEFGVTRYTWIGGDAVWEPQDVASEEFGVLRPEWSGSLVRLDRDCYYMSNGGPAAIRNGESAQLLPGVRRYLLDDGTIGFNNLLGTGIEGARDVMGGTIVWNCQRNDFSRFGVVYHVDSGRFSTVRDGFEGSALGGSGLAAGRRLGSGFPFQSLVTFDADGVGGALRARRYTATSRTTAPITFKLKRWRPKTGVRTKVYSVRPLLLLEGSGAYPVMSLTLKSSPEPRFATSQTASVTTSSLDANGWITDAAFPMEGGEFICEVTIPDLGGQMVIRDFPGLEFAYAASSVF